MWNGQKIGRGFTIFEGCVDAGFPSAAEDYLETPLDLTEFLIENGAATFLMRVDGDSMRDAGILHRDLLEVDRAAKPENDCIVVVAVGGEYTVAGTDGEEMLDVTPWKGT